MFSKTPQKIAPPLLGEQAKVDLFVYHKGAITFDETEKARVEKKKKNANMDQYVSLVPLKDLIASSIHSHAQECDPAETNNIGHTPRLGCVRCCWFKTGCEEQL